MQVSVPYLRSEYGKDYDFDAPVKLLDSMMHAMAQQPDQQVVVLSQVSLLGVHTKQSTRLCKVHENNFHRLCMQLADSSNLVSMSAVHCNKPIYSFCRKCHRTRLLDWLQVLASEVNIGYEDIVNTQVRQVNGKPVRNLSDLTKKIESCKDQYLKFDLEYDQVTLPACYALHIPHCTSVVVLPAKPLSNFGAHTKWMPKVTAQSCLMVVAHY